MNELEARQDPRLLRALDTVAPGTPLREGIDNIVHARTGGLILVAEPDEVSFLFSGGIKLDVDYTPALLRRAPSILARVSNRMGASSFSTTAKGSAVDVLTFKTNGMVLERSGAASATTSGCQDAVQYPSAVTCAVARRSSSASAGHWAARLRRNNAIRTWTRGLGATAR